MTDEMFGVITTVDAERVFEDVTSHHEVSQTETSKRRSQSFCLSVSLSPACQSVTAASLSISHSRLSKNYVYGDSIFISATKTTALVRRFDRRPSDHQRPSDIPPRSGTAVTQNFYKPCQKVPPMGIQNQDLSDCVHL